MVANFIGVIKRKLPLSAIARQWGIKKTVQNDCRIREREDVNPW